ncbi:PREDICTED: uncharacterized protein LOC109126031 [Camelina sativa]|uniref:Uncharacterized protein LOC109126031 n=1 Tax=Camelina sativa TaxID=90675 RepID=A0ABM1QCY6_CAMSA|nr:PREDICTED: uncharacterized protein LOC109126031 [Camelina sativa]
MVLECVSHFATCGSLFYHCSICNFTLDPVCATKPTFINHPKRHEHTLYYFTRKSKLMCVVCGEDYKYFIFVCLHCDFIVHKKCIYLPQVIKISLHKHRLSFASSLSFREWACGVCRKDIDTKYGAYTCMTKGCIYGVHTNCATSRTRGIIWDIKELEGEPEEDDENIKPPFEEIRDGIILHFSHPKHLMRLDEDVKRWCGEEKYCQACILPLYDGKSYTCVKCDYVFHEACAYLPRVKQHALHAHLLTLEPSFTQIKQCQYCNVKSCGFKYVCYNVDGNKFSLDVRCASISEPYDHHLHMHPLLFNSSTDTCSICGNLRETLTCDRCGFLLCFRCAGFPYKVRYLNDEHLLTFSYRGFSYVDYMSSSDISEGSYEEDAKGDFSCDLCEEEIILRGDSRSGFYRCEKCEVALHVKCCFGEDLYMNPGSRVTVQGEEFNIVKNSAFTRPICMGCQGRCKYKMMFIAVLLEIYIVQSNTFIMSPRRRRSFDLDMCSASE